MTLQGSRPLTFHLEPFRIPMIPISKNMLADIRKHALEEYPFECCGIVIGKAESDSEDVLFRCRNVQNLLHKNDPKTFQRDARTAYYIDPKELMFILKEADSQGKVIKIFYHSHPEHDAYFSEEDMKMALFDGEPLYPYATYLVVSVFNRRIKKEAFFSWDPETRSFLEKK